MTNKEFQDYLKQFPDDMECFKHVGTQAMTYIPLSDDHALEWSDTAKYDEQKDKIVWGNGKRYLLFNYPIQ